MAITKFYNFAPILSHNCTYNFVLGARGLGKTYGISMREIRKALKTGKSQFMYVRRYQPEIQKVQGTFFDAVGREFPDYQFRNIGWLGQAAKTIHRNVEESDKDYAKRLKERKWRTICYFVPLVTAQSLKSVPFPDVDTIIYDEFIKEAGHTQYLPNETVVFNNLFETVDRSGERTKAFFLANTVSMMNPFFIKYDVQPDEDGGKEWVTKYKVEVDGVQRWFVCCHFPDSDQFKREKYATAFGQFIQQSDPDYAEYSVGNKFKDAHNKLIAQKHKDATYWFTLNTDSGWFSVWQYRRDYFIQVKRPRGNEDMWTLEVVNMDERTRLMHYNDKAMQLLRASFKSLNVYFDRPATRNVFGKIFERQS
jgi:hypothetical protein